MRNTYVQRSWKTEDGRRIYDPIYFRWRNMKSRCYNPNDRGYARYGGRGIKVCDHWLVYENFREDWLRMGGDPDGTDIDRIDNDGDYCPENCRRVTHRVNVRNTHRRREITWQGETKHYLEWAEVLGINHDTLRSRVFRRKWPLERAMTEGVNNA